MIRLDHVSIRAPAWGATGTKRTDVRAESHIAFQSAPPHGGRHRTDDLSALATIKTFQSAPPHGGRREAAVGERHTGVEAVSIRAPAWGATSYVRRRALSREHRSFQSAPPHGGRPTVPRFQVRQVVTDVSIRAPAWGATDPTAARHTGSGTVSIRAPAWGATRA